MESVKTLTQVEVILEKLSPFRQLLALATHRPDHHALPAFSRPFTRRFGLPPSLLTKNSQFVHARVCRYPHLCGCQSTINRQTTQRREFMQQTGRYAVLVATPGHTH